MSTARMLVFLAALGAAGLLLAQSRPSKSEVTIEGFARDADTRAPVAGARITVRQEQRALTDPNGRFEFKVLPPETVQIQAVSDGYTQLSDATLIVEGETDNYKIELKLVRSSEVHGVLVDEESNKPIRNLKVVAERGSYVAGQLRFDLANLVVEGTSGDDGGFRLGKLIPGDYVLEIQAEPAISIEPLPPSNDAENNEIQNGPLGYGLVVWPGTNADYPQSAAIRVESGNVIELGEIRLRRQQLKNITALVQADCSDGGRMTVLIQRTPPPDGPANRFLSRETLSCRPFRILNVPEGRLSVQVAANRGYGAREIDLRSRNPLFIAMEKPLVISGVLEIEGASKKALPEDLTNTRVSLRPLSQIPGSSRPPQPLDSEGNFQIEVYPQTYLLKPPPGVWEKYYLKGALYNGAELQDPERLQPSANASDQSLRMVLASAAMLQAHVQFARGQSDAFTPLVILLVPDDLSGSVRFAGFVQIAIDKDGYATQRGLRPGEYHAFMAPVEAVPSLQRPGVLDAYLDGATAVALRAGQSTSLSLEYR